MRAEDGFVRTQLVDLLLKFVLATLLSGKESYEPYGEKDEKRQRVHQEAWVVA